MILVGGYFAIGDANMTALILTTLGFGLVGFIDDYLKVIRKKRMA